MAQDPTHFLNELPIWKLKIVAAAFKIDVSECRYKRDYVEKVKAKRLTEEQVRNTLADARRQSAEKPPAEPDVKEIGHEIEQIAERPTEPSELPKEEEQSVGRNLDESLAVRPSFFEVDSATESAYNRMILGDYYGAIKLNREARLKCLETFSNAQVYSAAVSIRAAEELLARFTADHQRIDPLVRTALAAAKRAFISGPPRQREEALESLETLVEKAYESLFAEAEKEEGELKALLKDYESFGARTEEARRYLEIASQAKSAFNIAEYAKFLDQAKERAVDAKAARAREIDDGFRLVRAAAAEAREVGVDTGAAEIELTEARRAFDDGSFANAVALLAGVERAVDEAHLAQMRSRKDLEARQVQKVNAILATYEPMLAEASNYGMDVKEGMLQVSNLRAAMANKDIVRAVNYSRRVREFAAQLEKPIEMKKVERGIIKRIEGARCPECSEESLYMYPDGSQKCFGCGHSSKVAASEKRTVVPKVVESPVQPASKPDAAPAESEPKKKKGFFRW